MVKTIKSITPEITPDTEMKKLILYASDMDYVDINTIKKVITKNVEDNVYEITQWLTAHKGPALKGPGPSFYPYPGLH